MTVEFIIRAATVLDVDVLAHHRMSMFRDMGKLPDDLVEPMMEASRLYFARAVSEGEYLAWLASPAEEPGRVVAGAGLQLRPSLPGLRKEGDAMIVTTGLQGLVLNVYTERPWRSRGLARLLMNEVIAVARVRCAGGVVLHASPEGRPLYDSLGFEPTNEMRLTAPSE